jgi:membrane-associated phospholipid phosphatase
MTRRALPLALVALLAACATPTDTPVASGATAPLLADGPTRDAVIHWNQVATEMVARVNVPAPLPPTPEALFYAMSNGAVHDALNGIDRRYEGYAYQGSAADGASAPAAVAAASHGVLAAIATGIAADPVFPNPVPLAYVEQAFAAFLGSIPDGPEKAAGIALGTAAANAMLGARAADGSAGLGLTPYLSSGAPGAYRPTPPFAFDAQNLTGLADSPDWGKVRPFVVPATNTFRAQAPYGFADPARAVLTPRYTRDFEELTRLGGAVSERTAEQTAIAFFWMENSPLGWNRVARILGAERGLDGWELAHLFALLHLAEADAYLTSLESKYHYRLWRPLSAIRFADEDGNPATEGDPGWDVASSVLGVPTPPVPEYPSAHATAGAAAVEVLRSVFPGRTAFSMESSSLPGATRSFASVAEAAEENAASRVYIGYHFRHATEVGLLQGRQLGRHVVTRALRPAR